MKKLLFTVLIITSVLKTSVFAEIKIGIILGFTGPIESLAPAMANSAEIAFKEASESGLLLNGETIRVVKGDSTCKDSSAANDAAKEIISQGVKAIIGGVCSEVTKIILSESAVPNEIVMISPAAASASLTSLDDKGFFFRTTPSEARGGQILADITKDRRVKRVWGGATNFYIATCFFSGACQSNFRCCVCCHSKGIKNHICTTCFIGNNVSQNDC